MNTTSSTTLILYKLLTIILILLLTLQFATALGIRPAKTIMNSEEIKVYKSTIWVVNNDHQEMTIGTGTGGEFGQYLNISPTELTFREDIDALPIEYEINLPSHIPPGGTSAYILIEEKKLAEENENNVDAKISLKHKIIIQNGYPEKYIEPKLNFHESGDNIRLVSEINNLGKKDIDNIKTKFYINNILQNNKEKIEAIETPSTDLKTKENKLLETTIPKSTFTNGEFEVQAITFFDDQQIELSKKLVIGKPEIDITYFDKYFKANEINKYTLDLLNKWNTQIENVFVDIIVKKDNKEIDQFRTKSIDLDARSSKRISDYFDARNKNPGTYSFDMNVNFWDTYRMQTKTFSSELLSQAETPLEEIRQIDSESTKDIPSTPTGNAIAQKIPATEAFISKEIWYAASGAILASLLFVIYHAGQKRGRDEFEELITATRSFEKVDQNNINQNNYNSNINQNVIEQRTINQRTQNQQGKMS